MVFLVQAATSVVIGGLLLATTRERLHWLVLLSACQSLVTRIYELIVAIHLRQHLSEKQLSVGIGSLVFSGALFVLHGDNLSQAFSSVVACAVFFGTPLLWPSCRARHFLHQHFFRWGSVQG